MDASILSQENIIKSISYSQDEILNDIITLYVSGETFDLDPTYSKGVFYRNILAPKWKFDLYPINEYILQSDAKDITRDKVNNEPISSIMFDPPFLGGSKKKGKDGIIKKRFGYYKNIPALWAWYKECLQTFYTLLEDDGVLVFKCQDSIECSKQFLSHIEIINMALQIGFYPKDLFILLAKNRIIGKTHRKQQHCRKYHSYFIVFKKQDCKVPYSILIPDN